MKVCKNRDALLVIAFIAVILMSWLLAFMIGESRERISQLEKQIESIELLPVFQGDEVVGYVIGKDFRIKEEE